jgi:hypothetical protein
VAKKGQKGSCSWEQWTERIGKKVKRYSQKGTGDRVLRSKGACDRVRYRVIRRKGNRIQCTVIRGRVTEYRIIKETGDRVLGYQGSK